MKNVVSIVDNELRLCSGLGEYAFGKTNYNSVVTQKGFIAECDSQSGSPLHFSFEPWTFEDIKSFDVEGSEERVVFFCSKNPFTKKAVTLLELFERCGKENASKQDMDNMYLASLAVCTILTQAANEEIELPVIGGGGIIVDGLDDNGKLKLLFLPQDIFKHSIAGLSAVEQSDLHNCWINPSLQGLPAISFARASTAYKMLTGRFAYPSSDTLTRNADILDRKFLPLELSINGINQTLAEAVNKGLKLNSNSVLIPGKKAKGKKNEDLAPEKDFPLELLATARENISSTISDSDFEEKVKSYQKMQSSRVNTKRTIRRNTTTITVIIIGIIAVAIMIRGSYKNYLEDYTTKGFTSTQTIQAFFKGMNTMDITTMQTFVKGRSANRYLDSISNVYVISKQRQSSGGDGGYLKPAKFFLTVTDASKLSYAGLYGATNIKVDGQTIDEYIDLPKNKDKPEPLTQEKGVTIEAGDKSVHSVEYYILHTEGNNNDIYVTKNKDTFTLIFSKGKWIITEIETTSEEINFNSDIFKGEYFNSLITNSGDVVKTIRELSKTYEFLPSDKEMTIEKKALDEYLSDPFKGIL